MRSQHSNADVTAQQFFSLKSDTALCLTLFNRAALSAFLTACSSYCVQLKRIFTSRESEGSIFFSWVLFFSVNMMTHEPLHLAWWNSAWTCTSTTSGTLLNFKVIGQRSKSHGVFVCIFLHDTRGQYIALIEVLHLHTCWRTETWTKLATAK